MFSVQISEAKYSEISMLLFAIEQPAKPKNNSLIDITMLKVLAYFRYETLR